MGVLKKIKWRIIRSLLSDLESVILYDSCDLTIKQMRTEFKNGKWYDFPAEEERTIHELMKNIQGKTDFTKWS